jgi:hypothetical protein
MKRGTSKRLDGDAVNRLFSLKNDTALDGGAMLHPRIENAPMRFSKRK